MDNEQSTQHTKQNVTKKVIRGGAWTYGQMLITNLINLGVMAILARQLTPAMFGLVALAAVILRFMVVLAEDGVNSYVIYDNQEGREERVQAAFWLDLSLSIAVAFIGLLFRPLILGFYNEPMLGAILTVLILRYPIDTLSQVPDALLKKSLGFEKLAVRDGALEILTGLGSIAMALTGWGVWSLVIPGLVISPIRFVIGLWMVHWSPRFNFYIKLWPRIFNYSANIIGSTFTSFILNQGDTLLIGKLMGSAALGIYNLAWQASNMVSRNVTGIANNLALPALSAVSDDINRLRNGWDRMLRLLSITTFPLLIGLFVVADNFILTVYGPKWQEAILPLRIFIIYALRYTVGSPSSSVYKAVGRPDYGFKLGIAIVPFYLLSIWIGSFFGIVGVAIGVTLARTVFGIIGFELVARCLKTSFWKIVEPLWPALLASCWMGGVVLLAKFAMGFALPDSLAHSNLFMLLIQIAIGGLAYLVLLRTFYRNLARDMLQAAKPLLGPFQGMAIRILNA